MRVEERMFTLPWDRAASRHLEIRRKERIMAFEKSEGRALIEEMGPVETLGPQHDLPAGPTFLCPACRTRLRTGQPHSAIEPFPHQTYEALFPR